MRHISQSTWGGQLFLSFSKPVCSCLCFVQDCLDIMGHWDDIAAEHSGTISRLLKDADEAFLKPGGHQQGTKGLLCYWCLWWRYLSLLCSFSTCADVLYHLMHGGHFCYAVFSCLLWVRMAHLQSEVGTKYFLSYNCFRIMLRNYPDIFRALCYGSAKILQISLHISCKFPCKNQDNVTDKLLWHGGRTI